MVKSSPSIINPHRFGIDMISEDEIEAAVRVLKRKELFRYHDDGQTSETRLFEKEFSNWCKVPYAISVSHGTAGLKAALYAVGVQPRDKVLVSAFTFIATASAILALGAIPVPVEINSTLGMSLKDLCQKIEGAKAVVPVYVAGHSSNLIEVVDICQKHKVAVIEDACQGLGVGTSSWRAGTIADVGVFSFQQHKQLVSGEGGMLVTSSEILATRCRQFTDHGAFRAHDNAFPDWDHPAAHFGENARLSELQSAILRAQLSKCDMMVSHQRKLRHNVTKVLLQQPITIVSSNDSAADSATHLLLKAPNRRLSQCWQENAARLGLLLRPVWKRTFYKNSVFERAGIISKESECPKTEALSECLLALPCPPSLSEKTQKLMIEKLREFDWAL